MMPEARPNLAMIREHNERMEKETMMNDALTFTEACEIACAREGMVLSRAELEQISEMECEGLTPHHAR
jgi:hypothetical protein